MWKTFVVFKAPLYFHGFGISVFILNDVGIADCHYGIYFVKKSPKIAVIWNKTGDNILNENHN